MLNYHMIFIQRSLENSLDETYDEDFHSVDTTDERKLPKLVSLLHSLVKSIALLNMQKNKNETIFCDL